MGDAVNVVASGLRGFESLPAHCRSSLVVKHFFGKEESTSPILVSGSE